MTTKLDIQIGQIYNNLEVVSFSHSQKTGRVWNIKCVCGKIFQCHSWKLKNRKSCGCIKKDTAILNGQKAIRWENRKYTALYTVWSNMKRRCLNPNSEKYKRYGARGISIYNGWINNFDEFSNYILKTIGDKPEKNYTLDRINNNGNYEPGNLRWASLAEQMQNSSKAKLNLEQVEKIKGSTKSNKELAKEYGVPIRLINRILSGETWK